jgi:hypothetical protein
MAKDKVVEKNVNCHKEFKNGSSCVQQCGQFKEHMKNKQGGQQSKSGGLQRQKRVVIVSVDKCPVHPDGNHMWGTRILSIKTRNSLPRVPKRLKHPRTRLIYWTLSQQKKLLTVPIPSLLQRLTKVNSPEMSLVLICWTCSTRP